MTINELIAELKLLDGDIVINNVYVHGKHIGFTKVVDFQDVIKRVYVDVSHDLLIEVI